MGQEFVIKSTILEDKINQLLPSQGGAQAGVDLSASTTIIPIVDLTESAEGSVLRQDLQRSLSFSSSTAFDIQNVTDDTLVNTTGYFRVFGSVTTETTGFGNFELTDGVTQKRLLNFNGLTADTVNDLFDFTIFLKAGDSLLATANNTCVIRGVTRQIADINGNLVNP